MGLLFRLDVRHRIAELEAAVGLFAVRQGLLVNSNPNPFATLGWIWAEGSGLRGLVSLCLCLRVSLSVCVCVHGFVCLCGALLSLWRCFWGLMIRTGVWGVV